MTENSGWVAVALAAITLISVVVNAVIQRARETRQRAWDLEDRQAHAEAAQNIGRAIAANTAVTVQTSQELRANTAKTVEAAGAAKRAYDESAAAREEANGLTRKLEAIASKVRGAGDKAPDA